MVKENKAKQRATRREKLENYMKTEAGATTGARNCVHKRDPGSTPPD
jgi:hypothetical protein